MPKALDRQTNRYIISELCKKVFWPWIGDTCFDWSVVALTFYCAAILNHPIGYFLALFVIGNRQHALTILGHDGTHCTIHKNRKVNDWLSDIMTLFPIGLSTSGYRKLHGQHHAHLNTGNDPELMHRSSKAPQWDLPITFGKIIRLAAKDIIGYSLSDYWMIVRHSKPRTKRTYLYMILMHTFFLSICIYAHAIWIAGLWYFSLVTTFMMYFRLRTWLEHQGDEFTHRLKLNWFERLIVAPHNVEYHYEHHSYPGASYKNLNKVRNLLPEDPTITIRELLNKYKNSTPIKSGTPTRSLS